MKVRLTNEECELLCAGWERKEYREVARVVKALNPLEAIKLAQRSMIFYDETGGMLNKIIDFILDKQVRSIMLVEED